MHISADTLDDLLVSVLTEFLQRTDATTASKGEFVEEIGALLVLNNPRARLSRTESRGNVFSSLGEFLWYLAGSNELSFIEYYIKLYPKYSDDQRSIFGAYGPRLFRMRGYVNQVDNIVQLLKRKPTSRQAVIQLFDAEDIVESHKDIPCTCTLQFFVREGRLHMLASMRSNDAFKGLPADVFAFTMLQELIARSLGVELGIYKHAVGSLHLYEADRDSAASFIGEGLSSTIEMPVMPYGDPWGAVSILLDVESKFRCGAEIDIDTLGQDKYWLDLMRLLKAFSLKACKSPEAYESLIAQMDNPNYGVYIKKLRDSRLSAGASC